MPTGERDRPSSKKWLSRRHPATARKIRSYRTARADNQFLDDLLALATWIIPVEYLAAAGLAGTNERVGSGTKRVLLVASFHDEAFTWRAGRHDALTLLTAEHGNEPMMNLSGWLMSRKACTLHCGAEQRKSGAVERRSGERRRDRRSACWRSESRSTLASVGAQSR